MVLLMQRSTLQAERKSCLFTWFLAILMQCTQHKDMKTINKEMSCMNWQINILPCNVSHIYDFFGFFMKHSRRWPSIAGTMFPSWNEENKKNVINQSTIYPEFGEKYKSKIMQMNVSWGNEICMDIFGVNSRIKCWEARISHAWSYLTGRGKVTNLLLRAIHVRCWGGIETAHYDCVN